MIWSRRPLRDGYVLRTSYTPPAVLPAAAEECRQKSAHKWADQTAMDTTCERCGTRRVRQIVKSKGA